MSTAPIATPLAGDGVRGGRARSASAVILRTDVSATRAICLRSVPMSSATGSPQLTVTSIAPYDSTPMKCGSNSVSPYHATRSRSARPIGNPLTRV